MAHPHNERTFKSLQVFFQQEFEIENLENGIPILKFYYESWERIFQFLFPISFTHLCVFGKFQLMTQLMSLFFISFMAQATFLILLGFSCYSIKYGA